MKRWMFKLVVFLLLGAIVNVAVAWGCAVFSNRDDVRDESVTEWPRPVPEYWPGPETKTRWHGFGVEEDYIESRHEPVKPGETGRFSALPVGFPFRYEVQVFRAGWPIHALQGEDFSTPSPDPLRILSLDQAWTIYFENPWSVGGLAVIPLRPIWPGFAINTIFYAAILWLLTLVPFTARRLIRHKRGLCIKCGYDLRGAEHEVCPECGAGYQSREREA